MMTFIRHKGSASTIQSIHMLENKIPEIKKMKKLQLKAHNRLTYISNTISNIVLQII